MQVLKIGTDAKCSSIFRLVGKDENALTYALGYLLAHDPVLLIAFLKTAGVLESVRGKRYASEFSNYDIVLQERNDVRRMDLVVRSHSGIRVIIEAKVGPDQPSTCQLLHYTIGCQFPDHRGLPESWQGYDRRFLITLTTFPLSTHVSGEVQALLAGEKRPDYRGIEMASVTWESVYELVQNRLASAEPGGSFFWSLNEFLTFLREDYVMPYYDAEIMIREVNDYNWRIFTEGHLYRSRQRGPSAPLYFGPYHTGRNGNRLSQVGRCIRVIDDVSDSGLIQRTKDALSILPDFERHWVHWHEGLKLTSAIDESSSNPPRLRYFFLDQPQELGKIVRKGRIRQIPVGFHKTFQELLANDTLS